jgi:hypothetical protein
MCTECEASRRNKYIGKYGAGAVTTNTASPNAGNYANMEGLTASGSGDTRAFYGGGNDLDNSGRFEYVSLRYGGKVVGLGNELNGLSLGGIGHIEIMNNVDDGIEFWGGCVDLKYVAIWNIGDDSFDVDQGWRGRVQFGLIVAGYSIAGAASGSGFCDSLSDLVAIGQLYFQILLVLQIGLDPPRASVIPRSPIFFESTSPIPPAASYPSIAAFDLDTMTCFARVRE